MSLRRITAFLLVVAASFATSGLVADTATSGSGGTAARPHCIPGQAKLGSHSRLLIDRSYRLDRWRATPPLKRRPRKRLIKWLSCLEERQRRNLVRHWGKKKASLDAVRRYRRIISVPGEDYLESLRACETGSSGLYATDTGNGFYGAYQFTLDAWQSVGGTGYPDDASKREQDIRAALLYRIHGSSPWPVCG